MRDLEGALEVEKSALEEARQNMEMIIQQKRYFIFLIIFNKINVNF